MQFRRKKPAGGVAIGRGLLLSGGPRSVLLLALGIVASLVLLLLSSARDDTDYYALRREESSDEGDAPPPSRSRREEAEEAISSSSSSRPQASSLLSSPSAVNDLPKCTASRHDLSSPPSIQRFDPQKGPAVFANWSPPALEKWSDRSKFSLAFGAHEQYVKGRDVQPLTNGRTGERCTASTSYLMQAMDELARREQKSGGDVSTKRRLSSSTGGGNAEEEEDLLFFTNDVENPSFLDALSRDYTAPAPFSNLSPFAPSDEHFRVFSAMERGSSHPLHSHGASWLGQVSGSRLWFFLPPGTPKGALGPKVNGCDYLLGRAEVPAGATACVQEAGEVVYFPSGWVHATW